VSRGDEAVLIARGHDRRDESVCKLPRAVFFSSDLSNVQDLVKAFQGCQAVAHCAGINREIGSQTYQKVHVEGTRNVVEAAKQADVTKIVLLSFLRARPNCGSAYHESKRAAEEIVRASHVDFTILKAGVIYGQGDHLLDHLSHALYTFPVFGLVGMKETRLRPLAIEDLVALVLASLTESRLSRKTLGVTGPEELTLREVVERIANEIGKRPRFLRVPIFVHRGIALLAERFMTIPLISLAQLRILSEGVVEAKPPCDPLPADLAPARGFTPEQIRKGLPEPGAFGLKDLRCSRV
jgi:uncharacterized protein YbjT (DUF2867 family)